MGFILSTHGLGMIIPHLQDHRLVGVMQAGSSIRPPGHIQKDFDLARDQKNNIPLKPGIDIEKTLKDVRGPFCSGAVSCIGEPQVEWPYAALDVIRNLVIADKMLPG